jgi:KipI family sensor histidine kinase inhibitor
MGMQIHPYGDRAVLVSLDEAAVTQAVADRLSIKLPDALIRTGIRSVLVEIPEPATELQLRVTTVLLDDVSKLQVKLASVGRTVEIPVEYNGEDLQTLASYLECSEETLVGAHCQTVWRVAIIGFAPGFPYLVPAETSEASRLFDNVPRLPSPRTKVPAGSVAVAAGMCAIYPTTMPGGWMLLGISRINLFDPAIDPPSLLLPGDLVHFTPIARTA